MGIGLPELFVLLVLMSLFLWIFAIINVLRSDFPGKGKLLWFVIITFAPIVGTLAYFFIGTKQKINNKEI